MTLALTLENPNRSHWVTLGYHNGGPDHPGLNIEREELYPILTATIRGQSRRLRFNVNRYLHSQGMSEWRVWLDRVEPDEGIGGETRRAINEAARPIISAWLDSPAYRAEYRRSVARAIAREIRDENTTAGYRARDALALHGRSITAHDRKLLVRALRLRMDSLALCDSVGS